MSDDIKKILKMLEDGKVSVDEAEVLIDAIQTNNSISKTTAKAKSIKIYVYDKVNDKKKVDITIPLSLAKNFLKFGLKFAPKDLKIGDQDLEGVDFDEIIRSIENGAEGTLVDVDEDTERVIIKVE
jgi:hypothetical protein